MHQIRKRVAKRNEKIKAINISLGYMTSYEELSRITGITINSLNIVEKIPELIKKCRYLLKFEGIERQDIIMLKTIIDIYDEIDYLESFSIAVVIAAGNISDNINQVNLFALNEKAIVVGGTARFSNTPHISFINSPLADLNATGVFDNKLIPDDTFIHLSSVKDYLDKNPASTIEDARKNLQFNITGTSYTTPFILNYVVKMLQKDLSINEINRKLCSLYIEARKKEQPVEILLEQYLK